MAIASALFVAGAAFIALGPTVPTPAHAQAIPKSLETGGTDAAVRERKNQWTVGVAGGLLSGTNMTFADELAKVLDDGDNLRILPVVTYGAASNLEDLLYLRGIDVAVTQSDVFEFFRTQRKINNLESRINYIIRLPTAELHVVARTDINSLQDLRGKKVNFGKPGTGSSLTGPIVFQRLGVQVEETSFDDVLAMQKLRSGEIAATLRLVNKPLDPLVKLPANSGLHLVPIPFSKQFEDFYALGEFTPQDYPNLVPPGTVTDTISVPQVLAVFNWQKNTDRYRKVQRFVEAFFTKFEQFQMPPRHPKWRDVNLAATVPGWTRWGVAEEMLQRLRQASGVNSQPAAAAADFAAFLKEKNVSGAQPPSADQRDALFREFLQWQQARQGGSRTR
ncbi:MAG TPA: TAXI family TRAP transporter solute-binding subunit [Acetobacteraceae bacterium]|nr:TAXI family TRAP transporter solute-binding subunit [Acetobacteraceae bacterium]